MRKHVDDLGAAAYLRMLGFNVVGRRGRNFYFEFDESEEKEFNKLCFEYLNSSFHQFDAYLMSLKKMKEHMPED